MDPSGSGGVEHTNRKSSHSTSPTRSERHVTDPPNPLRIKITEILAGTANGCISELGYQPGTLQKLQALEKLNAQQQTENMKLYEDNHKLAQSVDIHKNRLKYLSAGPDANRIKHIQDLEERVRMLTAERAEFWKQTGAADPAYHWLQQEYKKLMDLYRAAQNEIQHLRGFIHPNTRVPQTFQAAHVVRTQGGQPLPAPPYQSPNPQSNRDQSITLHHPTPAGPLAPHRSTGQLFSQPSSQSGVPYTSRPVLPQSHVAQGWRHHQVTQGSQGNIISTGNRPSISIPAQVDAQHWNLASPVTWPVPPATIPSNDIAPPPTTAQQALATNSVQASNRISHSKRTSLTTPPTSATQQFLPNSYHFVQQGQASTSTLMQPPSNSPTIPQLHPWIQPGDITAARLKDNYSIVYSPESVRLSMPPTPPDSSKAESPSFTADELIVTKGGVGGESCDNPVPLPSGQCLKRTISRTDPGSGGDEMNKKARIEAARDSGAVSAKPPEERIDEAASALPKECDEGDLVPVGNDGLRILSDCLDAVFGEDETEEGKICGLCSGRFESGLTPEPPKRFRNATEEQLLEHCTTTHPKAWDAIRQDV